MGIWKDLPAYPTPEDVIFELNSYLVRDGRPQGDFSEQTFNSFFPTGWEKNKHGEIVSRKKHITAKREKRLEKHGYFAKKGKFGFVLKKNKTRSRA